MPTQLQPPSLSLIYLCLNEEAALATTLGEAVGWAEGALADWEILVVDDGSTDGSARILAELGRAEPRIRLLQHTENRGMGAGLRTAIAAATKDYFCMLAADGQIAPGELDKMWPALAEAPIVLSTYADRDDGKLRTLLSAGFRLWMRALVGIDFKLEGTYLFPVALARDEIGHERIGADTFFFSFELIARALQRGVRAANTVIACRPRQGGGPSRVANLARIRRVAAEVIALRRRQRAEAATASGAATAGAPSQRGDRSMAGRSGRDRGR